MKQYLWLLLMLLAACQNQNQAKDQKFFNLCPPGSACLSPYFAVNRLKRDIVVKYDPKLKRFVQTDASAKDAIILHPDDMVDFWRVPQYVVATPGVKPTDTPNVFPDRSIPDAPLGASHPG